MGKSIPPLSAVSEVELVYRNKVKPADRIRITSTEQAYNAFINAWDLNKIDIVEQFYVLFVDFANNCLGICNMFTGGTTACYVDPKIIFATALKINASKIFIAHNHPSGNLIPSMADKQITLKIRDGGKLLDIVLLDHLIITPFKYYSFAEESLIL